MVLPSFLQQKITEITSHININQVALASADLSNRYRAQIKYHDSFMKCKEDYLAYLITRFPATYGVISRVFKETQLRLPISTPIHSLLDIGAGPGTGFLAATQFFNIEKASLIEKDNQFISIGKQLTDQRCLWLNQNLESVDAFEPHDLVIMSYALGELPETIWNNLLKKLIQATNKLIVIIEPGTPLGFLRIKKIRNIFIAEGGHILAPCPHHFECPLMDTSDWCHFPQRIERSFLHRKIKNATLSIEDEKFSYIVIAKDHFDTESYTGRIINKPEKHSGHVTLSLCTQDGIKIQTISRKNKLYYKKAKKSQWGMLL